MSGCTGVGWMITVVLGVVDVEPYVGQPLGLIFLKGLLSLLLWICWFYLLGSKVGNGWCTVAYGV